MTVCPWCGDPEQLEIGEIWGPDFTLHACCEGKHDEIITEMAADPQWATDLLRHLGAEEFTGFRLRRLYDGAFNPPVLDFKLSIEPVTFARMRAFVGEHHAHCAPPVCWRYGAAIYNGRTLVGGLRDRRIPVALILFADTGSEKPETYAYLPIIQDWLARNGMPPVTVLKRNSPRAGDTSLHGECLRKRVLPSLAYGGHSCSVKWKVDPQWAATRLHFGWDGRAKRWRHGPFITKLIGYDAGPRDSRRMMAATGKWPPGHNYRYPLQDWSWTREFCEERIIGEGLPVPVKSACFFCPASKKPEVDWLASAHPELMQISMEMERLAHERGLTTTKGLGRRWSWTEYLALQPNLSGSSSGELTSQW